MELLERNHRPTIFSFLHLLDFPLFAEVFRKVYSRGTGSSGKKEYHYEFSSTLCHKSLLNEHKNSISLDLAVNQVGETGSKEY